MNTQRFISWAALVISITLFWSCRFDNAGSEEPVMVRVKFELESTALKASSLSLPATGYSFSDASPDSTMIAVVVPATTTAADCTAWKADYYDVQMIDIPSRTVNLTIPLGVEIRIMKIDYYTTYTLQAIKEGTITSDDKGISAPFNIDATTTARIVVVDMESVVSSQVMGEGIQGTVLNLSGVVTTLAGSGDYSSNDAVGVSASFDGPHDIATDGTDLFVADKFGEKVRKINIATSAVTTLAGGATGGGNCGGNDGTCQDGIGTAAQFYQPAGITLLNGYLYIADQQNHRIRRLNLSNNEVITFAGSGVYGFLDGSGTSAEFRSPTGITTDGTNIYVADMNNNRIRKIVVSTALVSTIAGGDNTSDLWQPHDLTTNGTHLFVADLQNHRIRQIVISSGLMTTLAGTGEAVSQDSSDGTGATAKINEPEGITTDGTNLYITDHGASTGFPYSGSLLRKIVIATGATTTIAGGSLSAGNCSGANASYCRDGTGTDAMFNWAHDLASDGTYLYLSDFDNNRIRKIQ